MTTEKIIKGMASDRLSPASGGPLVDPEGHEWTMVRRRLDVRVVRRALRNRDQAVLIGEDGGFSLRWVEPTERSTLWERVKRSYAGPGGEPGGYWVGCQFADDTGNRIVYLELHC